MIGTKGGAKSMNNRTTMKEVGTCLVCLEILIVLNLTSPPVSGALPEGMAETLELRIQSELDKVLQVLVTEKQVCEELWLTWPVEPPKKDPTEVEREIDRSIRKQSMEMFPVSLEEELEERADAKYKAFQVGEPVSFKLKHGEVVSGYLRDQRNAEVLIDNRTIKLADVDDDELAHFDEDVREMKIREYVRSSITEVKEKRIEYEQKIRAEVSQELYIDAGYIKVKGMWIAKKQFVSDQINDHKAELSGRLKPLLRTKVYYESGFMLFEDEWVTKKEFERRQQLLLEEQERLDAAEGEDFDSFTSDSEGEDDDQENLWE